MTLLKDKIAVVTGGGSGIGLATVEALGTAGATVVIGNRNTETGEKAVAKMEQIGVNAIFQRTDVTDSDQVKALVDLATNKFGRLDIAFNNAGFDGEQVPLHEQSDKSVAQLFDVNIKGVFHGMKHQIAAMLQNPDGPSGSIINNSSIFGLAAYPGWSLYVATKHAVTGMTKGAALDYAKQNIRVNAVGPGPIETPLLEKGTGGDPHSYAGFVPMGRIGQPREIADAVAWLASDQASFVTGHTLPVDGGVLAQ